MTNKFLTALTLVAALTFSSLSTAPSLAQSAGDEQADCMSDALRLCGQFVPDRGKITACMIQKKSQLSAACRRHFK
jgi:hypothetical protein